MSAPLTVLAVIAGQTNRVKLGTGVQVLPLTHPLRLAEETATVDQISRGRLLMASAAAAIRALTPPMACRIRKARALFRNTGSAEACLDATQFFVHGKFHHFDEARAVPRPFQSPHPPIRIAGASEDTFPVLGALGYPLFVAVRSGSLGGLAPDLVRIERLTCGGHKGRGEVHLRLSLHIAETDAEAQAQARESTMAGTRDCHATRRLHERPSPRRARDVRTLTYDAVMRDKMLIALPIRSRHDCPSCRINSDRWDPGRAELRRADPAGQMCVRCNCCCRR